MTEISICAIDIVQRRENTKTEFYYFFGCLPSTLKRHENGAFPNTLFLIRRLCDLVWTEKVLKAFQSKSMTLR